MIVDPRSSREGGHQVTLRVRPSTKVASILYKLDWSTGCEWSAHVSPEESELLARIVRDYYELLNQ